MTRVYHPKRKAKYEEYERNGEGSYLLETQFTPRLVFEATRCYAQVGRYINHSHRDTNWSLEGSGGLDLCPRRTSAEERSWSLIME